MPSNVKELRTIRLTCEALANEIRGRCVTIRVDNTTAMFYISKHSGAHSFPLHQEALLQWELCVRNKKHLVALYLPMLSRAQCASIQSPYALSEVNFYLGHIPYRYSYLSNL